VRDLRCGQVLRHFWGARMHRMCSGEHLRKRWRHGVRTLPGWPSLLSSCAKFVHDSDSVLCWYFQERNRMRGLHFRNLFLCWCYDLRQLHPRYLHFKHGKFRLRELQRWHLQNPLR